MSAKSTYELQFLIRPANQARVVQTWKLQNVKIIRLPLSGNPSKKYKKNVFLVCLENGMSRRQNWFFVESIIKSTYSKLRRLTLLSALVVQLKSENCNMTSLFELRLCDGLPHRLVGRYMLSIIFHPIVVKYFITPLHCVSQNFTEIRTLCVGCVYS